MSFVRNTAKKIADFVYKHFEKNGSGAMILLTTMTGIALSAFAQTGAILVNNKYTTSQKAFMIPQELTEGCITILSLLLITTPLQKIAKKAVSTGRIRTKELSEYMIKHNLFDRKGNADFEFSKSVGSIIDKIKKSDEFIKSSNKERVSLLNEHNNIMHSYDTFSDMTSALATTAGSVFTTALVSPLLRNYTASYYQKVNMDVYNNLPQELKDKHVKMFYQQQKYRLEPCLYKLYKI